MKEKIIDSMCEIELTPADFITLMFERTDEQGVLYIPGWHYDGPGWEVGAINSTDEEYSYRCRLDWNLSKYEMILDEFNKVYDAIEKLAKYHDEIFYEGKDGTEVIKEKDLLDVWNLYIKDLDGGGIDFDKFDEIYDKLDTLALIKYIASKVANGEHIEDYEREVLTEYIDISVSDEELEYRKKYILHFHKEAEKRFGKNICAYDIYRRAWRLWKLFALKAPKCVINNEGRQFAAAFVLNKYGISRELVDNDVRLRIEREELMSDEELDELYRPKKANTRKSLAPLFVYSILFEKSDSRKHLRQQEILNILEKYPYEISLERKALSRIIHNLIDSAPYAVFQDKSGVWIDQEKRG